MMNPINRVTALLLILICTASCGSFKPVYPEGMKDSQVIVPHTLKKGDHLRLMFKDGRVAKANFQSVNEEGLTVVMRLNTSSEVVQQQTYSLSDVIVIEKWESQPWNTVAVIVSTALIVAVIIGVSTFHPGIPLKI